jgi:putative lipoprotein
MGYRLMKQGTSHILPPLVAALVVSAGAAMAASPTSPAGRWLAEDIRGSGVIDYLQSVLEIAGDGGISGTGGCNRIMGKARIEGATITLGPLATTRMACSPAVMDQERKFLAALEAVRSWRIDTARHKLLLLGAGGETLVVLTRM